MSDDCTFRTVTISPQACLRRGWALISDQYWLFVLLGLVTLLLASVGPLGMLCGPLFCGLFLCLFARMRGEPATFNLLFTGFEFFGESFIATLLLGCGMLMVALPLAALMGVGIFALPMLLAHKTDPLIIGVLYAGGGLLLLMLFAALQVITPFIMFVYPLIADRRLKAVPAITASFHATCANWRGLLLLALVGACLTLPAALFCYLPMFLVLPLYYAGWAVAYREIFPGPPPRPVTPGESCPGS